LGRLRAAALARARSRARTHARVRSRTAHPGSKRLTASRSCPRSPSPLGSLAYPPHGEHTPERAPPSPAADDVSTWVPARLACFRRRSDDFALSLLLSASYHPLLLSPRLSPPTNYPPGAVEFHNRESRRAALEMECVTVLRCNLMRLIIVSLSLSLSLSLFRENAKRESSRVWLSSRDGRTRYSELGEICSLPRIVVWK